MDAKDYSELDSNGGRDGGGGGFIGDYLSSRLPDEEAEGLPFRLKLFGSNGCYHCGGCYGCLQPTIDCCCLTCLYH
jgi:hypothetical protein